MKIPAAIDMPYRLFRKHLPTSIYIFLKNKLGRGRCYFTMDYYFDLVGRYAHYVDVKNKTVLEIGPGNDISTGILMVLAGAKHVFLVDRISNNRYIEHSVDADLGRVTALAAYIHRPGLEKTCQLAVDPLEVLDRISVVDCYFTDTDQLLQHIGPQVKIDVILSNTVLEHVDDLMTLFNNAHHMLTPQGVMFHYVDVSDHAYHVLHRYRKAWMLDNYLNHMEYSDRTWAYLNDRRALNMNRKTLPYYLDLCDACHFDILKIDKNILARSRQGKFRIHPDIYKNVSEKNTSQEICSFSLLAKKKASVGLEE